MLVHEWSLLFKAAWRCSQSTSQRQRSMPWHETPPGSRKKINGDLSLLNSRPNIPHTPIKYAKQCWNENQTDIGSSCYLLLRKSGCISWVCRKMRNKNGLAIERSHESSMYRDLMLVWDQIHLYVYNHHQCIIVLSIQFSYNIHMLSRIAEESCI